MFNGLLRVFRSAITFNTSLLASIMELVGTSFDNGPTLSGNGNAASLCFHLKYFKIDVAPNYKNMTTSADIFANQSAIRKFRKIWTS